MLDEIQALKDRIANTARQSRTSWGLRALGHRQAAAAALRRAERALERGLVNIARGNLTDAALMIKCAERCQEQSAKWESR